VSTRALPAEGAARAAFGPLAIWAAVFVALALLAFVADDYTTHILILIFFWAYLGQSWNILGGYAGQFSFGHAAFFGVGAYSSTALFVHLGLTPWIGLLVGGLLGLLLGLFIGFLSFRYGLRGSYFALATLAFSEILFVVVTNGGWLGGGAGLLIPLWGQAPWLFQFASKQPYYFIILAMLAGVTLLTYRISRAKLGFSFVAIRENENAAEAIGVDTFAYKMRAMALSSFLTTLGGTFYAQYFFYIDPALAFGVGNSVEIILRPIVGGAGTIAGPIVGSFILTPLGELTRQYIRLWTGQNTPGVDLVVYGALLIAVIIFLPNGVVGAINEARARRRRRAEPLSDPTPEPTPSPSSTESTPSTSSTRPSTPDPPAERPA
jgi:branched-chain amino acid transport system permease protein